MGNGYGMDGGMGWGWLFGLVAITGLVLLVVLVVRLLGGGVRRGPAESSTPHPDQPERAGLEHARHVLAERYARGEIDTAEYHERLDHLQDE